MKWSAKQMLSCGGPLSRAPLRAHTGASHSQGAPKPGCDSYGLARKPVQGGGASAASFRMDAINDCRRVCHYRSAEEECRGPGQNTVIGWTPGRRPRKLDIW